MPQTAAQRNAAKRARREALGFRRLELWAYPALHDELKKIAARLCEKLKALKDAA